MRYMIILLSVLLISDNAIADQVAVVGGGNLSCGKWIRAINERNEYQQHVFTEWVAGYLVSYNYYRNKNTQPEINQPDLDTISIWLTSYCQDNPTDITIKAAAALVQHLGGESTKFTWKK